MDDRELLEKAAKAAGNPIVGWLNGKPRVRDDCGSMWTWSSLANNDDAMELAVQLELTLLPGDDEIEVVAYEHQYEVDGEKMSYWAREKYGNDRPAAWRRAITRCAAALSDCRSSEATP